MTAPGVDMIGIDPDDDEMAYGEFTTAGYEAYADPVDGVRANPSWYAREIYEVLEGGCNNTEEGHGPAVECDCLDDLHEDFWENCLSMIRACGCIWLHVCGDLEDPGSFPELDALRAQVAA